MWRRSLGLTLLNDICWNCNDPDRSMTTSTSITSDHSCVRFDKFRHDGAALTKINDCHYNLPEEEEVACNLASKLTWSQSQYKSSHNYSSKAKIS